MHDTRERTLPETARGPSSDSGQGARRGRRRGAIVVGVAAIMAAVIAAVASRLLDDDGSVVATRDPAAFPPGWSRLPDPPLPPRTGATVAWTGSEVVVVGGWESLCPPGADCTTPEDPPRTDGAAFDPQEQVWRRIAEAPVGFTNARATVVEDEVYLLAQPSSLLRYRPVADTWDELPAPPDAGWYRLVGAAGGLLAVATSDEQGERPDWRLDPATETWVQLPDDPLPDSFDRQMVADGDDVLLFVKARTESSTAGLGPMIGARLDPATGTWTGLPTAPGSGFQAWGVDGSVVVNPHFGRDAGGGIFDPATGAWRDLPNPPAAESWQGDMAGVLGRTSAVYEYARGWVLDLAAETWIEVPELDPNRSNPESTVTAIGRSLVVYGGERWVDGATGDGEGELLGDAWVWTP